MILSSAHQVVTPLATGIRVSDQGAIVAIGITGTACATTKGPKIILSQQILCFGPFLFCIDGESCVKSGKKQKTGSPLFHMGKLICN